MIYEWKCKVCDLHVTVHRPVAEYNVPPKKDEYEQSGDCIHPDTWVKVYKSSTPFEHLKNAGIFPNQYGDIPPRKIN